MQVLHRHGLCEMPVEPLAARGNLIGNSGLATESVIVAVHDARQEQCRQRRKYSAEECFHLHMR
eukprot:1039557-Prymnesium_polylepis.1